MAIIYPAIMRLSLKEIERLVVIVVSMEWHGKGEKMNDMVQSFHFFRAYRINSMT